QMVWFFNMLPFLSLFFRQLYRIHVKILSTFEKYFLGQRSIVETVIEQLKSICQIEHTRHRKPENFVINLLSGLAAYMLKPRKPSLKIHSLNKNLGLLMSS
ncbi:transposase, partial [Legionella pneumophila]